MTARKVGTAALDDCRGALVEDIATGFVGVLVDVIHEFVDPAQPRTDRPRDMVFIRPRGGGREHTTAPDMVCLVEVAQGRSCSHPRTEERGGKIYCSSCGAQLYL
ncbi:hypothetical protein GCM10009801_08530 [Streptomyces albiaxialis]|uniref:Uncharacterized protein n=1 Tax=Streptomyces albiaxialis TaxID=329523 RepID=A0ABN2VKD1_9ACTN